MIQKKPLAKASPLPREEMRIPGGTLSPGPHGLPMFSLWGGCKLLAVPTTLPALRRSRRRCCSVSGANGNETGSSVLQALSPLQREQISLYVRALLEWNQRMNLTAVRDESEAMARHVEDSLAIIPPLRSHYASRCRGEGGRVDSVCDHLNVVDVGTGPGLPGLILAIACPNWKLTLLESMQKRCQFLEHAIGLTGLSNVQVLCDRAEDRVSARSWTSEKHLMWRLLELLQK